MWEVTHMCHIDPKRALEAHHLLVFIEVKVRRRNNDKKQCRKEGPDRNFVEQTSVRFGVILRDSPFN